MSAVILALALTSLSSVVVLKVHADEVLLEDGEDEFVEQDFDAVAKENDGEDEFVEDGLVEQDFDAVAKENEGEDEFVESATKSDGLATDVNAFTTSNTNDGRTQNIWGLAGYAACFYGSWLGGADPVDAGDDCHAKWK